MKLVGENITEYLKKIMYKTRQSLSLKEIIHDWYWRPAAMSLRIRCNILQFNYLMKSFDKMQI